MIHVSFKFCSFWNVGLFTLFLLFCLLSLPFILCMCLVCSLSFAFNLRLLGVTFEAIFCYISGLLIKQNKEVSEGGLQILENPVLMVVKPHLYWYILWCQNMSLRVQGRSSNAVFIEERVKHPFKVKFCILVALKVVKHCVYSTHTEICMKIDVAVSFTGH